MNEHVKEIKSGALKKVGEYIVVGTVAAIVAIGGVVCVWGKELWIWWKKFQFTPAQVSQIEFWLLITIVVVLVLVVVTVIIKLIRRNHELQRQLKQKSIPKPPEFPISPNLMNTPKKGNPFLSFGPEEKILGDMSFEVLKLYSRFTSPNSALSVKMVCDASGLGYDDALAAVQELHDMKYIRVLVMMPGKWNSHYQITPIGRDYVMNHAT